MLDINVNSYLEGVKKVFPKFDKNNLQSSNETLARYAQIIYVRGLRDNICSYKCKNCGEYTCGEYEKKTYKFCPRCGEKLED